jgi:hypothetical protein
VLSTEKHAKMAGEGEGAEARRARRRELVAREVAATERSYVEGLELLVELYEKPL